MTRGKRPETSPGTESPVTIPTLPARDRAAHKGAFGRALVIAGSRGMVGAAALAGDAVLRAGAGLCTVAAPESVYPILAARTTCCTTHPLPETAAGGLSLRSRAEILALAADFDVVAIGPGLGRHGETARVVGAVVARLQKPLVVDADGLNALAGDTSAVARAGAPRVLTPHPGEMARLLGGVSVAEVQKARGDVAARFAAEHAAIVVLKGHATIVTDGKRIFTNTTGNPGMATGGMGDVLTGVITGLIAQGVSPFDASVLGVYVHGLAGDLAAAQFGETSLIATDVLAFLPRAFKTLATG